MLAEVKPLLLNKSRVCSAIPPTRLPWGQGVFWGCKLRYYRREKRVGMLGLGEGVVIFQPTPFLVLDPRMVTILPDTDPVLCRFRLSTISQACRTLALRGSGVEHMNSILGTQCGSWKQEMRVEPDSTCLHLPPCRNISSTRTSWSSTEEGVRHVKSWFCCSRAMAQPLFSPGAIKAPVSNESFFIPFAYFPFSPSNPTLILPKSEGHFYYPIWALILQFG